MSLDELEAEFRERQQGAGEPLCILAVQMLEKDVRELRPILTQRHLSLSEYVRAVVLEDRRRMPIAMLEIR